MNDQNLEKEIHTIRDRQESGSKCELAATLFLMAFYIAIVGSILAIIFFGVSSPKEGPEGFIMSAEAAGQQTPSPTPMWQEGSYLSSAEWERLYDTHYVPQWTGQYHHFQKTADSSSVYNCIAFMVGCVTRVIDTPEIDGYGGGSQNGFLEESELAGWLQQHYGFVQCPQQEAEIAVWAMPVPPDFPEPPGLENNRFITHGAVVYATGACESKLGSDIRVLHPIGSFDGSKTFGSGLKCFKKQN